VAAEQHKVEREEKKAKAEAECARKAEARNNKQAIQTTQIGKRKASQSSKPKAKRVQRSGNNGAGAVGGEPSHDAPVRRSTPSSQQPNIDSASCLYTPCDNYSKKSRNNSYCTWLNILKFVVMEMVFGVHEPNPGTRCMATVA
jgi:hypothetical protein